MKKSLLVRAILAMYATAVKVLDPATTYIQSVADFCAIGHTAKFLGHNDRSGIMVYNFLTKNFGVPLLDVDAIYNRRLMSRKEAAEALRDLADKLIIGLHPKSKMNRAALLSAARRIEANPSIYSQGEQDECMLGIATGGYVGYSNPQLGLTLRQWQKPYWFGYNNNGQEAYVNLHDNPHWNKLTQEEKAAKAVARLRRMAIYGT